MNPRHSATLEAHPIVVLEAIVARYGPDLQLTFSRYEIGPAGDQERRRRTTFQIEAGSMTRTWLKNDLKKLGQDEELALHSQVSRRGVWLHLPMIDYEQDLPLPVLRDLGLGVLGVTRFALPSTRIHEPPTLYSFETGRSYHQYADALIPEPDWHRYLGSLLLLTPPSGPPISDVRWIGHALRKGYAALRWSHNTARYVSLPRLVDRTTIAGGAHTRSSQPSPIIDVP